MMFYGKTEPNEIVDGVPVFNGRLEDLGKDLAWTFPLSIGRSQEERDWKTRDFTLVEFLDKLFDHKESKKKNGACFMQGALVKGVKQRTIPNVHDLNFMVLDIDSGQPMEEVRQELIAQNLFGVLYTTYSHGTTETRIKKTELIQKLKLDMGEELTDQHIRFYLTHHKRYDKRVVETCHLVKEEHVEGGNMVFVSHAPMPKYRIVLPLAETFILAKQAGGDERKAREKWKRLYVGVAHQLGASYDRSCTDISRLFFWPTHRPGGEYRVEVVIGDNLDLSTVTELDPKELENSNPFTEAGIDEGDEVPIETPWLKTWMRGKYVHFAAGDFFSNYFDVRNRDGDKVTTECPFDDGHTNAGDSSDQGFFCVDGDSDEKSFVAHCQHDSCSMYRKLNFVDRTIQIFNLTEEDLDQFIPLRVDVPRAIERDTFFELLAKLPSPHEVFDLPIEQTLELMEAAVRTGDPADKVRVFDALKPYRRSRKDLEELWSSARSARSADGRKRDSEEGPNHQAAESKLFEMNERFGVVKVGGAVKIVDIRDPDGYSFMSKFDFKTLHENQFVMKGEDRRPLADEWLKWGNRRTFDGVEFAPGGGREGFLNLFSGFPFKPECGGSHVGDGWRLLQAHIFENLCHGRNEWYGWLMTWFADIIQNPETKRGSCVIVRGEQGVGKSIVFDLFRELLGGSAVKVDSLERLTGRFNSCLSGKLLAHLDEGMWAGNRSDQSKMKNLVTSPRMYIERKGLEGWDEPNFIRVAITSNDRWLMSMTEDDRRNFILECGTGRQNDTLFFKRMVEEMRNGGFEAWMFDLMNWEPDAGLGGWEILRKPPTTPWATEQMALSKRPEDRFFERLKRGEQIDYLQNTGVAIQLGFHKATTVDREDLAAQFDAYMGKQRSGQELVDNPTALAKLCVQHFPGLEKARQWRDGHRVKVYTFPALEDDQELVA